MSINNTYLLSTASLNNYSVNEQNNYSRLLTSQPTDINFDFQQIIDDCKNQLSSYDKEEFDIYYLKDRKNILEAWYAFEVLWIEKRIKVAGVQDISLFKLKDIIKNCYIKPRVYLLKENISEYFKIKDICKEHDILLVYYLTIERLNEFDNNQLVYSLKDKYRCTTLELLEQLFRQINVIMTCYKSMKSYKRISLIQEELWALEKMFFQSNKEKRTKILS